MKMFVLIALVFGWLNPSNPSAVSTKTVDTKASTIVWTGHKVTGKHYGKVKIKNGELTLKDGMISTGTFSIDMTSISCDDLTGETNGKLVGHLKSDDFFGVEKYPTATLKINRAVPTDSNGSYRISADLTIKGKTTPIRFNAKHIKEGGMDKAMAKITIDRTDYDVRYGSGSFFDNLGDKTIYDEFDLDVTLVLN